MDDCPTLDPKLSTVVILGAGASKASRFGLPCMTGFFTDESLRAQCAIRAVLDELYGKGHPIDKCNLEDVITYIEAACEYETRLDSRERRGAMPYAGARSQMDTFLRDRLDYGDMVCRLHRIEQHRGARNGVDCCEFTPENSKLADPLHSVLFHCVFDVRKGHAASDQSTLITLNYDLVAELSLAWIECCAKRRNELKGGRCLLKSARMLAPAMASRDESRALLYQAQHLKGIRFLKLHGSLGWRYCPNDDCPGRHYLIGRMDTTTTCPVCAYSLVHAVVPPTSSKAYSRVPTLDLQWRLAVERIEASCQVIVIGVSFAPTDSRLTWLLRYSLAGKVRSVFVVNQGDEARERAERVFGPAICYCAGGLEQFVAEFVQPAVKHVDGHRVGGA